MGYGDAIKRPFTDLTKLVIGIVIMLIPIVNFIGIGYLLQCAKSATKRDFKLPDWTNWVSLFITGIIAMIISIIWAIPTMIVAGITAGSVLMNIAPYITAGNMAGATSALVAGAGTIMIGAIITLVVGIIFGLLGVAATIRYAEQGKLSAAFEFGELKKRAFSGGFIAAIIIGVIYMVVVSSILSMIPIIGTPIASFIGGVALFTMVAEAYGKKK